MVPMGISWAAGEGQGKDPIFGGQIRSLTEPKKVLEPSNDPRFQDNKDGTVTDLKEGLMWKQQDSYQELKQWLNWKMAHDYINKINGSHFAGHDDWRLPTRKELKTLYDESKSIPWDYYWTTNKLHIDPIFGYTSCCFWTSETHKDIYAWTFNFIRGKAYPSPKEGPGLSLSVIRAVRFIHSNREAAEKK